MSELKTYTNYEIVLKLLGRTDPVGETHTDNKRFDNLQETIALLHLLLGDIKLVASYKDRHEYSMRKAGEEADEFIKDIADYLK
jgi:hypothetical protein